MVERPVEDFGGPLVFAWTIFPSFQMFAVMELLLAKADQYGFQVNGVNQNPLEPC